MESKVAVTDFFNDATELPEAEHGDGREDSEEQIVMAPEDGVGDEWGENDSRDDALHLRGEADGFRQGLRSGDSAPP